MKENWKITVVASEDFKDALGKVLIEGCKMETLPDDCHLLENISRNSPDLVFLQLKEPSSYTFSLTREIKLLSPQTMVMVVGDIKTPYIPILAFRSQVYDVINWPTSEKELKERLKNAFLRKKMGASKAAQERLHFSLVHRLRNPLGAISGHVQKLLMTLHKLSERQIEEGLRQILSSCVRIEESLNEFLSLHRGGAQSKTILDINTIVESALTLLVYRTTQGNIQVERSLGAGLPHIKGHSKDLLEAFINVITNSIEAMEGGGRLTVETSTVEGYKGTPGKWVCVAFKDSGRGIKEEDLTRVFTPFFTTKEKDNIGLGLSIVKEIVAAHQGYIEVKSEVAKGTEFYIYLPSEEGQ